MVKPSRTGGTRTGAEERAAGDLVESAEGGGVVGERGEDLVGGRLGVGRQARGAHADVGVVPVQGDGAGAVVRGGAMEGGVVENVVNEGPVSPGGGHKPHIRTIEQIV